MPKRDDQMNRQELLDELTRLRAQVAQLLGLLEACPAEISVQQGPEHVFRFANQAMRARWAGRQLVGRPLREALPEAADGAHHEWLDRVFGTGVLAIAPGAGCGDAPAARTWYYPMRAPTGAVEGVATITFPAGAWGGQASCAARGAWARPGRGRLRRFRHG